MVNQKRVPPSVIMIPSLCRQLHMRPAAYALTYTVYFGTTWNIGHVRTNGWLPSCGLLAVCSIRLLSHDYRLPGTVLRNRI